MIVLPGFLFYIKENKRKQQKRGLFRISICQQQKRKENLICYNVMYKVILINPLFGTQHRLSVCQEKFPNILNHLPVINRSQDVIVSILAGLIARRPRNHGSNSGRVTMLCAFPSCPNQFLNPQSYFLGFESDHPPPSSARTINQYAIPSLPPIPSQCVQG